MAGYLDQYGAGEERRNRIIIRSVLTVLIVAVVVTLGWYLTLNHHQEGVVKDFVAALKRGDTQGAYRIWGCTSAKPCPDYPYEKFLKDWGPGPDGPDLAVIGLTDSEACNNAVMLTLRVNPKRTEQLWLDRTNDRIGFAPFPICPMQIPYEIMAHRTVGKLRKIFLQ
jgi:hypothetical protein